MDGMGVSLPLDGTELLTAVGAVSFLCWICGLTYDSNIMNLTGFPPALFPCSHQASQSSHFGECAQGRHSVPCSQLYLHLQSLMQSLSLLAFPESSQTSLDFLGSLTQPHWLPFSFLKCQGYFNPRGISRCSLCQNDFPGFFTGPTPSLVCI